MYLLKIIKREKKEMDIKDAEKGVKAVAVVKEEKKIRALEMFYEQSSGKTVAEKVMNAKSLLSFETHYVKKPIYTSEEVANLIEYINDKTGSIL